MTSIGSSGSGAFLNIYVTNAVSSKRIEKRKMSLPVPHNSARLFTGYTIHWITQEIKSFCIKSLLLVKSNHTNVQSRLQPFTSKGRCWHLSVSATRLRRYSFAVSRDERRRIPTPHNPTPAPTRLFYEESQISKRQARLLQEGGLVVSSRQERLYTGIRSYITRLH